MSLVTLIALMFKHLIEFALYCNETLSHYCNKTLFRFFAADPQIIFEGADERLVLIPYPLQSSVDPAIWGPRFPGKRWNTHPSNLFISAVSNIERTGRSLGEEDRKYLRWLLTWYYGWSATPSAHFDDGCFKFIRYCYPNLQLDPILDDITFPEEVAWMPCKRHITEPFFLLLASPTHYYVYAAFDYSMYEAGTTLKEVYEGLRNTEAFHLGMKGSGWTEIEIRTLSPRLDDSIIFPKYDSGVLIDEPDEFWPDSDEDESRSRIEM